MQSQAKHVLADLQVRLSRKGLDLFTPFDIYWYNSQVPKQIALPSHLSPAKEHSLAVLIGNSKALWQPFVAHLQSLKQVPLNPLDQFVESSVQESCQQSLGQIPFLLRYVHDTRQGFLYSAQKVGHYSGCAFLDLGTHLNIHQIFGPWIAFRAVVIFGLDASSMSLSFPPVLTDPCVAAGCKKEQGEKLVEALEGKSSPDVESENATWKKWLAVRDACKVGRENRYSEDQIRYHYLANRQFLENVISKKPQ